MVQFPEYEMNVLPYFEVFLNVIFYFLTKTPLGFRTMKADDVMKV